MLEVVEVELVPGLVVGNRWRLERPIGKGGFGIVWAAVDITTGEQRALKCLTQEGATDAKRQERLRREARAMAGITHPHVARVFGLEELPAGTPFIVMELIQGRSLHAQLARGALSIPQARGILIQIADALRTVHARGIIHRDLKPANVLIIDDRYAKVLDFGIARDVTSSDRHKLTTTGTALGTLFYMAPEQIFGERDLDPRCDVWALGVLAHECLTLRRPTDADGDNSGQVLKKILDGNFPRLSSILRDVPRDIDDLVARMLLRDVASRPTSEEIFATLAYPAMASTAQRSLGRTKEMMATLPISEAPMFALTFKDQNFAGSQLVPSTVMPPTVIPSTKVPSTNVPSTVIAPTEMAPTIVPSQDVPSTVVPSTNVPSTQAPSTQFPATMLAAMPADPRARPSGVAVTLGSPQQQAMQAPLQSPMQQRVQQPVHQPSSAGGTLPVAPAITPPRGRPADEPTFDMRARGVPQRKSGVLIALAVLGGFIAIGIAIFVIGTYRARTDTATREAALASASASSALVPAQTASIASAAVSTTIPTASAIASATPSAVASTSASATIASVPGRTASPTNARRGAVTPTAPAAPATSTSSGRNGSQARPAAPANGDPPITNERF